jgi:hypothetical protein
MTGRHEMLVKQNADVPMRDNAILMGLALPKGSRLTRATGGDWPASGRRLVHSRRPDRSSARIFCRHELYQSYLFLPCCLCDGRSRLRVHVLTRLMPPRSTLDLPVSHYPKIHSADQLGPVCLGGFHVGHSLLQSARV